MFELEQDQGGLLEGSQRLGAGASAQGAAVCGRQAGQNSTVWARHRVRRCRQRRWTSEASGGRCFCGTTTFTRGFAAVRGRVGWSTRVAHTPPPSSWVSGSYPERLS